MSRFKRLSHVIWCCKYHVVWVPKYRFRILKGPVAEELYKTIHVYCGRMGCAGSRYFCESLFWASQPKQAAKT